MNTDPACRTGCYCALIIPPDRATAPTLLDPPIIAMTMLTVLRAGTASISVVEASASTSPIARTRRVHSGCLQDRQRGFFVQGVRAWGSGGSVNRKESSIKGWRGHRNTSYQVQGASRENWVNSLYSRFFSPASEAFWIANENRQSGTRVQSSSNFPRAKKELAGCLGMIHWEVRIYLQDGQRKCQRKIPRDNDEGWTTPCQDTA